jgi:hypothetical protein
LNAFNGVCWKHSPIRCLQFIHQQSATFPDTKLPKTIMRTYILFTLIVAGNKGVSTGQDIYPLPIPKSQIAVHVTDVATLPNPAPGVLPRPIVMTEDSKKRLFVNDLAGLIYHVDDATATVTEYIDLRSFPELEVVSGFHGLQSFAFHPDFHRPEEPGYGRFYLLFSSNQTESSPDFSAGQGTSFHTLLVEFVTADPSAIQFSPKEPEQPYREILRINQPYGGHVGGLIAFNPTVERSNSDHGNLYIAMGDGASGGGDPDPLGSGQNVSNPFGAILRIDPLGSDSANGNYGIVPENVFSADHDEATLPEIFCHGLRNPQRFSWDAATGSQYIADIGHDVMEEVNLAVNGANYGWALKEGSQLIGSGVLPGLTDPIAEYDHLNFVTEPKPSNANRAITIGDVARGTLIFGLEGRLLVADFQSGVILTLDIKDLQKNGQGGFEEILVHEGDHFPKRVLEVINGSRLLKGLSTVDRADLRFSVNTPGRIFLINKQDGIIRRIRPDSAPSLSISTARSGRIQIEFNGILQSCGDLRTWVDLTPQPVGPYLVSPSSSAEFFKCIGR